jgi:hypothetical protein
MADHQTEAECWRNTTKRLAQLEAEIEWLREGVTQLTKVLLDHVQETALVSMPEAATPGRETVAELGHGWRIIRQPAEEALP